MTERVAFYTGKPHQSAVATWARERLVDQGGCDFDDGNGRSAPKQVGCLFADGVGLGKTWEALAAIALILDKTASSKKRTRSKAAAEGQRVHQRRLEAHVLILLPPGLVAKWRRELDNDSATAFPRHLKTWSQRGNREFVVSTLSPNNCFAIRNRRDLDSLPRKGSIRRGKYVLPPGTYLCNWNVFLGRPGPGRDRLTTLRNGHWDVVVADEAHHKRARKALDKLMRVDHTLLLTATPFQLDMTELHGLTKHLVENQDASHKVLKNGAVRRYAQVADEAFEGGEKPTYEERDRAQKVLRQLVACSRTGKQERRYFVIGGGGNASPIAAPTDLEQSHLRSVFDQAIQASQDFNEEYLRQRLKLARREIEAPKKHIAVELRKLLSAPKAGSPAPRLDALGQWARSQFVEDLHLTIADGKPRKLLVFTHLKTNVASAIQQTLERELRAAHEEVSHSAPWKRARRAAPAALASVLTELKQRVSEKNFSKLDDFARAIQGTLVFDLFGVDAFAAKAKDELLACIGADHVFEKSLHATKDEAETEKWRAHQRRIAERSAAALLDAVKKAPLAATFTGDETGMERNAIAEAFRTSLAPWVLVATNVGSEGIDLQTYTRHLVHFDVEWNPARMEQREGRIDRIGREHKEAARIYYLLVKDTYDERMFHQFVARQRWHGVLLGRKALQLDSDRTKDARLITSDESSSMSLDLDPRSL